jgi:yeast amino acid transporter
MVKMDHEKPEVVMPRIYEYVSDNTRSTISPDIEYTLDPSIEEPPNVEDRRERRGESLW